MTQLLERLRGGDRRALEALLPVVYDELKRVARVHMRRERAGHTLQPTALVHEAYIRLAGIDRVEWQGRAHFVSVAAGVMRRILIDHARKRRAHKRGGEAEHLPLEEDGIVVADCREDALLALDDALGRLADVDPRQARVVELRFFGGLTIEETASVLKVSPKTVKRDWSVAKAWLQAEMREWT